MKAPATLICVDCPRAPGDCYPESRVRCRSKPVSTKKTYWSKRQQALGYKLNRFCSGEFAGWNDRKFPRAIGVSSHPDTRNSRLAMLARGKILLLCFAVMTSSSCSRAPSVEVIGSFFPAWMFCIIAALIITGLIRLQLVRRGFEKQLGPLIVLYPSIAVGITCLLWLILFS